MRNTAKNIIPTIIFILFLNLNSFAQMVVDTTGMDFQNYGYTGSFGQQIVVDSSGTVHVCYTKTWCTESDTGYQVMYANVTEGRRIPILSEYNPWDINPSVVYMDGGHNNNPIYFYFGIGNSFWERIPTKPLQALAYLDSNSTKITPLGFSRCWGYYYDPFCHNSFPIAMEVNQKNGIVHNVLTNFDIREPNAFGINAAYWNFDGRNFGETYQMLMARPDYNFGGKDVPDKYMRNGTKGVDITVSPEGDKVTIATLHTASNILLHTGIYGGELWDDNFYTALDNGNLILLFDTTNSATGDNIPNTDPKPFSEVQISYDESDNLHVVYDATYLDLDFDTSAATANLKHWDNNILYGGAGDTNAVFYDGTVFPKPQIRYWNSITKTHSLLAECKYPLPGESFKWFSFGDDSVKSVASWGKFINDSPISNIEFFVNKDKQPNEPKLICVWEEMQGDVTPLFDSDSTYGYTYYAYMKDLIISVSDDGETWTEPYNITNTPNRDEGEVSVYRDVIDNKIHLVYSEDKLPGSDLNLSKADDYENNYIQNWPQIDDHNSVQIRKESTEQVLIIYREFDLSLITDVKTNNNLPNKFALFQNYPNPFNPSTTIKYAIPKDVRGERVEVRLVVYDVLGREVATLVNKEQQAGSYDVEFNASGLTSGVYYYRLQSGSFVESRKMLLLK